jgi:DNA-binding transcriptional regulator GbsR (MarR family)
MDNSREIIGDRVERLGKLLGYFGLTPMQGRIVAFMVISDPPEKTFDELVEFFNSSKSSVSNSLNYLLDTGIIDYRTVSEKRRRFFYVTDAFVRIYFRDVLENVGKLREMTYEIAAMRSPDYPEATEKILRWIENSNTFEDSLRRALDESGEMDLIK